MLLSLTSTADPNLRVPSAIFIARMQYAYTRTRATTDLSRDLSFSSAVEVENGYVEFISVIEAYHAHA